MSGRNRDAAVFGERDTRVELREHDGDRPVVEQLQHRVNRGSLVAASVPATAFVFLSTALLFTMKSWQSRESTRSFAFQPAVPAPREVVIPMCTG